LIYCFANSPLLYTYNMNLDPTQNWTAQSVIVTLDCELIHDISNTNVSVVNSIILDTNINLPNPNNYSLTISANSYQTQQYFRESLNDYNRVLKIQTKYLSNTGNILHANDMFITIKNSII
jgi:hypothetical protein